MPQTTAWENEYRKPQLVTLKAEPQTDVRRFFKWFKQDSNKELIDQHILDLGSGTGRNANWLAMEGNDVVGIELSYTAVQIAQKRARELEVNVEYLTGSIGEPFPYSDASFDLALDVMTSNSLTEIERVNYLTETHRVLKPGGYLFVRGLCKDGDKNTKQLLQKFPGPEPDTYHNQDMDLIERVFTQADFRATYSPYFTICQLIKKTNYQQFNGRSYKRNYWLGYLRKK